MRRSTSAQKTTVTAVYRPLEAGDPPFTTWNGIRFDANVAVELNPDDPRHHVDQLMPEIVIVEGEKRTKHLPAKMFMGDLARNNPWFEVDGQRARRKVSTRVVPPAGVEWTEAHEGVISHAEAIDHSVE